MFYRSGLAYVKEKLGMITNIHCLLSEIRSQNGIISYVIASYDIKQSSSNMYICVYSHTCMCVYVYIHVCVVFRCGPMYSGPHDPLIIVSQRLGLYCVPAQPDFSNVWSAKVACNTIISWILV